jgi:hypothetical protein
MSGSLHAGLSRWDWLQGFTSAAYGRHPSISPPPSVWGHSRSRSWSHCHEPSLTVTPYSRSLHRDHGLEHAPSRASAHADAAS